MVEVGLREWVQSLGIREASAVDAVVAMCHTQGCHTPREAAGTVDNQVFSEGRLRELLAGQKMNVRKKVFNGLERMGGRDSAGALVNSLASPEAPASSSGNLPEHHMPLNPQNPVAHASTVSPGDTSPVAAVQSENNSGSSPGTAARSPSPEWRSGDRALVREIFEIFNESGDGRLKQSEYAAFCAATEAGASCSDERWRLVSVPRQSCFYVVDRLS